MTDESASLNNLIRVVQEISVRLYLPSPEHLNELFAPFNNFVSISHLPDTIEALSDATKTLIQRYIENSELDAVDITNQCLHQLCWIFRLVLDSVELDEAFLRDFHAFVIQNSDKAADGSLYVHMTVLINLAKYPTKCQDHTIMREFVKSLEHCTMTTGNTNDEATSLMCMDLFLLGLHKKHIICRLFTQGGLFSLIDAVSKNPATAIKTKHDLLRFTWWNPEPIDTKTMKELFEKEQVVFKLILLIGNVDFKSFAVTCIGYILKWLLPATPLESKRELYAMIANMAFEHIISTDASVVQQVGYVVQYIKCDLDSAEKRAVAAEAGWLREIPQYERNSIFKARNTEYSFEDDTYYHTSKVLKEIQDMIVPNP